MNPSANRDAFGPLVDRLRSLSTACGVSGREGRAAATFRSLLSPWVDQVDIDPLGSVVALKKANAPKPSGKRLLIAAHLDEIGLLVTGIEKQGYLRFTSVGGYDARVLLGQEVLVHPSSRPDLDIPGLIGSKPPHYQSPQEQEAIVPLAQLYIDTGLSPARVKRLISIGDTVTLKSPLALLSGQRVSGKALDDRACLAALCLAMEQLGRMKHAWDVYAVATAQEEAGLSFLGARTSAFRLKPDLALVLDVAHADMPLAPEYKTYTLGRGPTIALGPNIHPSLFEHLIVLARRREIPYQIETLAGNSGTDAADIQITGAGVPTAILGVPVRYMHTPVETTSLADIERLAHLVAAFVSELDHLDLNWRD